jgi:hypothetical protein
VDGVTLIVGAGDTLTDPDALSVPSATLVAVTVAVVTEVKLEGAV